jgi:hypothetical protein
VVFTLMLSQTLSASSEALYERNDLDLLFSSPIGPAKVLFVRSLGVAGGVMTIFADRHAAAAAVGDLGPSGLDRGAGGAGRPGPGLDRRRPGAGHGCSP